MEPKQQERLPAAKLAEPRAKKFAPRSLAEARTSLAKDVEQITDKLYEAARDVVEQLEDEPAAELEARFNAGERDAYISYLHGKRSKRYTKQLSELYESDRSLRTRTDSFVRLFERLLDTVTSAPNGSQMVEACLGSETGKVYMLLAEASGRILPN